MSGAVAAKSVVDVKLDSGGEKIRRRTAILGGIRRGRGRSARWQLLSHLQASNYVPRSRSGVKELGDHSGKHLRVMLSNATVAVYIPNFPSFFLSIFHSNSFNTKNKTCSSTHPLHLCLRNPHLKLKVFEDFAFQTWVQGN